MATNPIRLLVVDDDPGMRDGMALTLKRAGHVVEQARSAEDALRLVRPGAFDAVITDYRMTGMDGLQLTARLKAIDPGLPVVLVTALESHEHRARGLEVGADAYIGKSSFDQQSLLDTIQQFLG